MFDVHRTTTTVAAAYPQTITEHRAPTDESVRLLREFEDAAREKLMLAATTANNSLGLAQVFRRLDRLQGGITIAFKLNGELHTIDLDGYEMVAATSTEDLKRRISRALAEAITAKILGGLGLDLSVPGLRG